MRPYGTGGGSDRSNASTPDSLVSVTNVSTFPLRFGEHFREHLKDSGGDFANTEAMLRAFPRFEGFVGSEKFLLRNLRGGGAGCITATANVNARAIARAFRERTDEREREIDVVRAAFESSLSSLRSRRRWRSGPAIPAGTCSGRRSWS